MIKYCHDNDSSMKNGKCVSKMATPEQRELGLAAYREQERSITAECSLYHDCSNTVVKMFHLLGIRLLQKVL